MSTPPQSTPSPTTPQPAPTAPAKPAARGRRRPDDAVDMGVPMAPPTTPQTVGPEDAAGAAPVRGDYTGRTVSGSSVELIPEAERTPGGPTMRVVDQGPPAPPATPPAAA